MVTKRMPLFRARHRQIPPSAVVLFSQVCAIHATYLDCVRGQCKYPSPHNKHCNECSRYLDGCRELSRQLGLRPWEMLGTNYEPPSGLRGAELFSFWRGALQQAIAEATCISGMA